MRSQRFLEAAARALDFQRLVENIVNERGFARAGYAGDSDHGAERDHHVEIFQIVRVRAKDAQESAVGLAARCRDGNAQFAVEIASGERLRRG